MAESGASDHRHETAAGGHPGSDQQRSAVTDATGGVFVEHRAGQGRIIPAQHLARIAHGLGQRGGFFVVHAFEEHGHDKRPELLTARIGIGRCGDQMLDLFARQRLAIALAANDLAQHHAPCSSAASS